MKENKIRPSNLKKKKKDEDHLKKKTCFLINYYLIFEDFFFSNICERFLLKPFKSSLAMKENKIKPSNVKKKKKKMKII